MTAEISIRATPIVAGTNMRIMTTMIMTMMIMIVMTIIVMMIVIQYLMILTILTTSQIVLSSNR